MQIKKRPSSNGLKIYYRFVWGKGAYDKVSAGIFTWAQPTNHAQKIHNKEALAI